MAETGRALAWPARAFFLLALLGLGACSVNPKLALPAGETLLLGGVPFHPQTEYQCGPAALAGVLGASGVPVRPETLVSQVYLPGRQGSLQLELLGATRRAGRIPYVIDREPAAVLAELEAGRPVLVLQNVLTPSVPRWHYAVVVGSDPARNRFILNTGASWARSGIPSPAAAKAAVDPAARISDRRDSEETALRPKDMA